MAIAFVLGHVVLAMLMRAAPVIATVHAIACLLAGLLFAGTTRRIRNVSMVVAYFAGCEVLWRMTKAEVFWEFGKYSIVAVLLVALLRIRARANRRLALAYFALLLPSLALTFATLNLDAARQEVSFNLSGPLTLTVAVLFFSNVRLTATQLFGAFIAIVGPVVGIGTLSLISTREQDALEFVNAANNATSGGFGPNQVAAMLGLAAMFLLLIIVTERRLRWSLRLLLFGVAAGLAAQAALTFARGGIVLALAGMCGAMFFQLRGNTRARITVVVVSVLCFVLGKYVIEPRLDTFTNGEFSQRFSNTQSSGRDRFISSELEIFEEHPILGAGPGIAMRIREQRGLFYGASHTEYSRMLAEHGIFGVFAIICLIALAIRAVRDARDTNARAIAMALVIWVGLFLLVYGTRVAAPALVFGLAFAARPLPPTTRVTGGFRA